MQISKKNKILGKWNKIDAYFIHELAAISVYVREDVMSWLATAIVLIVYVKVNLYKLLEIYNREKSENSCKIIVTTLMLFNNQSIFVDVSALFKPHIQWTAI